MSGRRDDAGLDDLVAATPADRDRVVDLLRAASILAVVAGHWLIATVVRSGGDLRGTNALAAMPWLRPLTWVFQVMPVFFIVGGFANLRTLAADGGRDTGAFLAARADRLLRPTVLFAAVWLAAGPALVAVWDEPRLAADVARIAAQPLWFLAVYVLVVLAAPVQWRLHRGHGLATLVVLALTVVVLDALRLSEVAPGPAVVNYLAVFLFAQGIGFLYAEGRFCGVRPRSALAVGGGALGVLVLLTTVGPYPVSMIGLPGQRISNMSPPTLPILVLGVAQGAVLLAAHGPLSRWLQRPRVWRATIVANLVVLTTFLWDRPHRSRRRPAGRRPARGRTGHGGVVARAPALAGRRRPRARCPRAGAVPRRAAGRRPALTRPRRTTGGRDARRLRRPRRPRPRRLRPPLRGGSRRPAGPAPQPGGGGGAAHRWLAHGPGTSGAALTPPT